MVVVHHIRHDVDILRILYRYGLNLRLVTISTKITNMQPHGGSPYTDLRDECARY